MKYHRIRQGLFLSRPNRFIALVEIDGKTETVHVKNTGRCKELLTERALVFLEESENPNRKTKFDLVAVRKGDLLINMDAQAPNLIFAEWAKTNIPGLKQIKAEVTRGDSRFDFYIEKEDNCMFVEVKGVTLEQDGIVMFPDAPTQRGIKHLKGLRKAVQDGYAAMVVFVVQMDGATLFCPNSRTHSAFAEELKKAKDDGVTILALGCRVFPDEVVAYQQIPTKI